MTEWIVSHLIEFGLIVLITISWLGMVYTFAKGKNKTRGLRRSFYSLAGLIGLALLISRPTYTVVLDSKVATIVPQTNKKLDEKSFHGIYEFLNDPISKSVSQVVIKGSGLSKEELSLLSKYELYYEPSDSIQGITDIIIPDQINENHNWQLKGLYKGEKVSQIDLILPDESIVPAIFEEGGFMIESKAPVTGQYLYKVQTIVEDKDTIIDLLPIYVTGKAQWNMLTVLSYPSFEMNYLKNYWIEQGNAFAQRTKIAKEKYQSNFVNMDPVDLSELTKQLISLFDFVLIDIDSWNNLSSRERSRILRAIQDDGLGLIIKPTETNLRGVEVNHPNLKKPIEITLNPTEGITDMSYYPHDVSKAWTPINFGNQEIAIESAQGIGSIVLLTIDGTHQLILADHKALYQAIWARLFSSIYVDFAEVYQLINPQWIWADEKTNLSLLSDSPLEVIPILNDSIPLPYKEVPFVEGIYEIDLYPRLGYNKINISGQDTPLIFYAHDQDSWNSLRDGKKRQVTAYVVNQSYQKDVIQSQESQEYPYYWWYVLMLLGFGMLWLDERMY